MASDQQTAADLLRSVAPDDDASTAIHGAWQDPLQPVQHTLVALDARGLCGVGTLWENALHPARWRVTLHGSPWFWSHAGAALMLDHLRALRPHPRPLQAAASARDDVECDFWRRQGFQLLMRTRRGALTPATVSAPLMADFAITTQRVTAAGYRLASLAELGDNNLLQQRLGRLHAAVYARSHFWNPVRGLTEEEAQELFLDPGEVIPDAMVVALHHEHLVGVSSLRRTADEAQVDLGWTGALPGHAAQQEDLVLALVGWCLLRAASANRRIMLEVDEADATLWNLSERLPLRLEPDWLTFAER